MLVKGVDYGVVHLGYVVCPAVCVALWCRVVRLTESRDPSAYLHLTRSLCSDGFLCLLGNVWETIFPR